MQIPLNPGEDDLESDSIELRLINDPTSADRDTLNLGLYDSSDADSRGNPENITNFLLEDKLFTLRISSTVFDQLTADYIDRQFMRFNLTVPEEEQTTNHVKILPPNDASGMVTLEGQTLRSRRNISGSIRNSRTSDSVNFNCDAEGRFQAVLAGRIGDSLEVHGASFTRNAGEYTAVIYPPTLELGDGYIHIRGNVFVDDFGGIEVEYEGYIQLHIDPVTGRIVTSTEADVDVPWFVAVILRLAGESLDDEFGGFIDEEFGRVGANLLPAIGETDRLVVFWEDVQVQHNGIILSGQIEAGRIKSAGRSDEMRVDIGDQAYVSLDLASSTISTSRAMLVDLGRISFEQLGVDNLIRLTYPAAEATLPEPSHLDGRVFAVRTVQHSYGKLRLNLLGDDRTVLRWVTYEPLIEPKVEIVGEWHQEPEPFGSARGGILLRSRGANRYWGEFRVELQQRLYDARGAEPEFHWAPYVGPGEFRTSGGGRRVSLEIDTEVMEQGDFRVGFRVDVTDIFRRTASARRVLTGSKFYLHLVRPEAQKEPPWDLNIPVEIDQLIYEAEPIEEQTSIIHRSDEELDELRDILSQEIIEIDSEIEARAEARAEHRARRG